MRFLSRLHSPLRWDFIPSERGVEAGEEAQGLPPPLPTQMGFYPIWVGSGGGRGSVELKSAFVANFKCLFLASFTSVLNVTNHSV